MTQVKNTTQIKSGFFAKPQKNENKIFVFCVITFDPTKIPTCSAPKNDYLNLSFVKKIIVLFKNVARIGHEMAICQLQVSGNILYLHKQ